MHTLMVFESCQKQQKTVLCPISEEAENRSVLTSRVTNDRVSIQIGRAFFNHSAQWADILQKFEIVGLSKLHLLRIS